MKSKILQQINEFQERPLRNLTPRAGRFYEIENKVDIAIGMRRTGKTFFCYQRINELIDQEVPKHRILYVNFEDDRLVDFQLENFQDILDVFYAGHPENKSEKCYFFFDEIQVVDQWEKFIRRLVDTENVQIFITGSSAKMLSTDIATSLRGRSLTTEIFPLNFKEFIEFRYPDDYQRELKLMFGSRNTAFLRKAVKEYMEIGGMPEVINLPQEARYAILQTHKDLILFKDIIDRHKIKGGPVLKLFASRIMESCGHQFSVTKFFNEMKSRGYTCSKNRLYELLEYFEDAFLFFKVPIHTRFGKQRTTAPVKIYTADTGLLKAMSYWNSYNYGPLLESMVFMHLNRTKRVVEYVRTKQGFEVDFFARDKQSNEVQLIQVCWDMSNPKTFNREVRALDAAMKEFSIKTGTIVTWDEEKYLQNGIEILPAWKWLVY